MALPYSPWLENVTPMFLRSAAAVAISSAQVAVAEGDGTTPARKACRLCSAARVPFPVACRHPSPR